MVVKKGYVPDRDDIVWITLNPQVGHEHAGRRPAAVLSPIDYNRKVGLALLCPITSRIKGYPFEVAIPRGLPVSGVILADQVKSLDWSVRDAEFVCKLPPKIVDEVLERLLILMSDRTAR